MENKTIEVNEQLYHKFLYWRDMAKSLDMLEQIEHTYALQFRLKYDAFRKVGFGKIFSWIATLKSIK